MQRVLSCLVITAYAAATQFAVAAGPQFDVQFLDGSRATGSLLRLDGTQLVIESATGQSKLDLDKLAAVTPQIAPAIPAAKTAVWVDLVDGSQLSATEYSAKTGRAKIVFAGGEVLQLPTAEIDAVRLQPASDANALEWSRIRGKRLKGDVLVTRKTSESAIDFNLGAIDDVTDATARFTLDGQGLNVKRAKIFGLIYYHAAAASTAESPYTITDAAGSLWTADSLKFGDGKLEFTSHGGRKISRGLDQIAKIDLSCGKIVYLSDLKPDSETFTPYSFTLTGKELASRTEFSRVRRDQNLESNSLQIHEHKYRKGLALRSRSELAWTVPGKFSRLDAMAGIDDYVRPLGNVRLQILGDGKPLLDAKISGSDKEARPVSLDVSGVRRLVLIVESQGNFGAGDHLDLGNLRLIK